MRIDPTSLHSPELLHVLGSPAGQQLLQLLNQDGGHALRAALEALQHGQPGEALAALAPVLESDRAAALLRSLERP